MFGIAAVLPQEGNIIFCTNNNCECKSLIIAGRSKTHVLLRPDNSITKCFLRIKRQPRTQALYVLLIQLWI